MRFGEVSVASEEDSTEESDVTSEEEVFSESEEEVFSESEEEALSDTDEDSSDVFCLHCVEGSLSEIIDGRLLLL